MKNIVVTVLWMAVGISLNLAEAKALRLDKLEPYAFEGPEKQMVNAYRGQFSVPENRSDANARTLTLTYVVFPTTSEQPGNPIVYLAGGPGGSATGTAKGRRFELFQKLRSVADVILFDQRGTGLSDQLNNCEAGPTLLPSTLIKEDQMVDFYRQKLSACRQQWAAEGVDLNGYNTRESARDIAELARVLNTEKLNLWGISYGTHLGLAVAKYHADIVDRIVFASTEGLDQTIKLPKYNDALLDRIDHLVQSDPSAKQRYPNWRKDLGEVLTVLDKQPVMVETQHPRTGEAFEVSIGKLEVQMILSYMMLKNPDSIARVPQMVSAMKQGVFQPFAPYFAGLKHYFNSLNPMALAMDAASGIDAERWSQVRLQANATTLGRMTNFPFPDIGAFVGVNDLGSTFRKPFNSSIDAVFLAGTLDGRTYIEEQEQVARQFTKGVFVTVENAGHDLFMASPKIGELMVDFYRGKPVPVQTIELAAPKFH